MDRDSTPFPKFGLNTLDFSAVGILSSRLSARMRNYSWRNRRGAYGSK